MKVKTIIEEDFTNYKLPVMFIGTIKCNGKCYKELSISETICHNHEWHSIPIIEIADTSLIERYLSNPITKGICFGGLEPFEQFDEIISFIETFRTQYKCNDQIVIYTGFYEEEITSYITQLKPYSNIVVKFGRFLPNDKRRYSSILGVYLSSSNQYAKEIGENND